MVDRTAGNGEVIAGRYVLCDPIGSGGSGTVWRALDRKTGEFCAAKLLRQRDAGELLRFVREQSVRLSHPHIVSPYSWAADDDMVLIASELIDGGSLQTLIGDYGPLDEPTTVAVLQQVLSALGALHDVRLIHRDVKPGNLLLRATGVGPLQVMLTDFGLTISQNDARLTTSGTVIGTPGYLPPEVLAGQVPPDPTHDLFAVGRLALTLLAGRVVAAADQHQIGIDSPQLAGLVVAMLDPDPASRPVNAHSALVLLAGADVADRPRTGHGDDIEVLDQLLPLPPGWETVKPSQPAGGQTSRPPRPPQDFAPDAASPVPPDGRPTVIDVAPTVTSGPTPEPSMSWSAVAVSHPSLAADPLGANRSTLAPAVRRSVLRTSSNWPLVAAVVITVTAAVVLVLALASGGSGTPGPGSTSNTVGIESTGSSRPTTTAGLRGALGSPPVTAGSPCSWQQQGDTRPGTPGGALTCTAGTGGYRWVGLKG